MGGNPGGSMSVWRFLAESARGTSHVRAGTPCQDSNRVTTYRVEDAEYLVVACSDGAGTAARSDVGSELACGLAIELVCRTLDSGCALHEVGRDIAIGWVRSIRERLTEEAAAHSLDVRDYACTLLLAVIGSSRSLFFQVGDGAIVTVDSPDGLRAAKHVFWPQNGEYANLTYFVTDPAAEPIAMFENRDTAAFGIAVFTDGIQTLALDYRSKSAHGPFFETFFEQLRGSADPSDLCVPFLQFLDSPAVNARTDDDKTLIIAVRGNAVGNEHL